ncbi:hypothetical protein BJV74DRAFT_121928 [Russula compacta]|nr:hypothetical protein BJV74DRAFT_121928 [Russula compacta]
MAQRTRFVRSLPSGRLLDNTRQKRMRVSLEARGRSLSASAHFLSRLLFRRFRRFKIHGLCTPRGSMHQGRGSGDPLPRQVHHRCGRQSTRGLYSFPSSPIWREETRQLQTPQPRANQGLNSAPAQHDHDEPLHAHDDPHQARRGPPVEG